MSGIRLSVKGRLMAGAKAQILGTLENDKGAIRPRQARNGAGRGRNWSCCDVVVVRWASRGRVGTVVVTVRIGDQTVRRTRAEGLSKVLTINVPMLTFSRQGPNGECDSSQVGVR